MDKKLKSALSLVLVFMLSFVSGCNISNGTTKQSGSNHSISASGNYNIDAVNTVLSSFSDKLEASFGIIDDAGLYDESNAVKISLYKNTAICSEESVYIEGGTITISKSGTYIISGILDEGLINVNAKASDEIRLVLLNADITSHFGSAIKLKSASQVTLTLPEGTKNQLSTKTQLESDVPDDSSTHACISASCDLIINGFGELSIISDSGNGIKCDQKLCISAGGLTLNSAKHGIRVQDELYIVFVDLIIKSGGDGIHIEVKSSGSGELLILDGNFNIDSKGDGISTSGCMRLYGGSYEIHTGEGSSSITLRSDSQGWINQQQPNKSDSPSQKGLKAEGEIAISNGKFVIDTVDDCLHSGQNIGILNGDFILQSGDDAIHSDLNVLIETGHFDIPYCCEGIEGITVTILGGDFSITSSDDGINAADDSSILNMRDDPFAVSEDCYIIIDGGSFIITADGDCIDSNGNLIINGGTLELTCNGNGNTAIDVSGVYTNNGGIVATNDGSEKQNSGIMHPGRIGMPPGDMGGRPEGTPPAGIGNIPGGAGDLPKNTPVPSGQ